MLEWVQYMNGLVRKVYMKGKKNGFGSRKMYIMAVRQKIKIEEEKKNN